MFTLALCNYTALTILLHFLLTSADIFIIEYLSPPPSSKMINLADFVCTEQQQQLSQTTTALTLSSDSRRLTTFLNQEERFMPNNYQTTKQVRNYEEERARVLELIYEVLFLL